GGVGGHQAGEGVAEALPLAVDGDEGVLLQEDAQAILLGVPAPGLEQPAVGGLALVFARRQGLGEGGVGVVPQVGQQPQFQGMDAGQVGLVVAVEAGGVVLGVEIGD